MSNAHYGSTNYDPESPKCQKVKDQKIPLFAPNPKKVIPVDDILLWSFFGQLVGCSYQIITPCWFQSPPLEQVSPVGGNALCGKMLLSQKGNNLTQLQKCCRVLEEWHKLKQDLCFGFLAPGKIESSYNMYHSAFIIILNSVIKQFEVQCFLILSISLSSWIFSPSSKL